LALRGELDPPFGGMNRYLGYNRLSERVAIAALDSEEYYLDVAGKMEQDKRSYYHAFSPIHGMRDLSVGGPFCAGVSP